MTREQIVLRGEAAARLLADETAMSAFAAAEMECFERWKATNPTRPDEREDEFRLMRAIALVKTQLETWKGQAIAERHNATEAMWLTAIR